MTMGARFDLLSFTCTPKGWYIWLRDLDDGQIHGFGGGDSPPTDVPEIPKDTEEG